MYLFHGEERYLIDKAIEAVCERLFGQEPPDPFRCDQLRAPDVDARRILEAVRTATMFGGQRLVIVREVKRLKAPDVDRLAAYSANPVSHAHLVLTTHGKVDGRKSGWKKLRKAATEVTFEPLYSNQMPDWTVQQARRHGVSLTPAAAAYLTEAIGTDMALIDAALGKLALNASSKHAMDLDAVQALVGHTRERNVFELTDALSARDLDAALRALHSLADQGEEAIKINFMIARHMRILLRLKAAQRHNVPSGELAQQAGVSAYFLKRYLKGAKHFQLGELVQLHQRVHETDRRLKSSRLPSHVILEQMVFEIVMGLAT